MKKETLAKLQVDFENYVCIDCLVAREAGYVPKWGEKLTFRGFNVEFLRAYEKMIYHVRLRKSDGETADIQV